MGWNNLDATGTDTIFAFTSATNSFDTWMNNIPATTEIDFFSISAEPSPMPQKSKEKQKHIAKILRKMGR